MPIDSINNTSQCVATKATVTVLQNRTLGSPDGRIYNVQTRDGTVTDPIGYAQYPIAALGTTVDFAGDYGRIHEVETYPPHLGGCQVAAEDGQLGCLVHADRCSLAMGDLAGETWAAPSDNTVERINGVCPAGAVCN